MIDRPLFLVLTVFSLAHADERTRKLAERLPEEAAAFAREATKYASEEKLTQHALENVRVVNGVAQLTWKDREVISRYGFVSFLEAPEALRELRQIDRVDGKQPKGERSLKSIAAAVTAGDEARKRKLLEDFEKAGFTGIATNMGQLLLLFNARKVQSYDFSFRSQTFIGAERIMIFTYAQVEGGGMTTYRGKDTLKSKLSGEIWVNSEYRPVKITLNSNVEAPDKQIIRQEMEVRYTPTPYPCVLPTLARHRELRYGVVQAETVYEYKPFRLWADLR